MKKVFNITMTVGILSLLVLTSCGSAPQADSNGLTVLASTSFLADIAQNVAGDRVQVESLIPFGVDPHAYQPSPADVSKLEKSTLLILNGLELEHFIEPLLESASGERLTVEATAGLTPLEMEAHGEHEGEEHEGEEHEGEEHQGEEHEGEGHEDEHGHGGEAGDPHMWLDPNLVITYVENIRDGLIQVDPAGADVYNANASAYMTELQALDTWIVEQVNTVPAERRKLITNHEVFGYFAERYGFEIVDAILPSFSSEANASAQEIASVIDAIKDSGAPAIFLSEVENADLANQIASETGVKVVDGLYLEALTDGEPAGTYIDMMKYNVMQIVDALK